MGIRANSPSSDDKKGSNAALPATEPLIQKKDGLLHCAIVSCLSVYVTLCYFYPCMIHRVIDIVMIVILLIIHGDNGNKENLCPRTANWCKMGWKQVSIQMYMWRRKSLRRRNVFESLSQRRRSYRACNTTQIQILISFQRNLFSSLLYTFNFRAHFRNRNLMTLPGSRYCLQSPFSGTGRHMRIRD